MKAIQKRINQNNLNDPANLVWKSILNFNKRMAKTSKKESGSKASAPAFEKTAQEMDAAYHNMMDELEQLRSGKKVASTRARNHANELKKLSLQIRKEIQDFKSAM